MHLMSSKKQLLQPLIVAGLTLVAYLPTVALVEYALTEQWLIIPKISEDIKLLILTSLLVLVFYLVTIRNKWREWCYQHKSWLVLLVVISLMLFKVYSNFYQQLQQHPKIFSISSNWSIQGSLIRIRGKNFGPAHEAGQVLVGDVLLTNKKWTNEEIIVEQPVSNHYFTGHLQVINHDDHDSNSIEFTIKDPGQL